MRPPAFTSDPMAALTPNLCGVNIPSRTDLTTAMGALIAWGADVEAVEKIMASQPSTFTLWRQVGRLCNDVGLRTGFYDPMQIGALIAQHLPIRDYAQGFLNWYEAGVLDERFLDAALAMPTIEVNYPLAQSLPSLINEAVAKVSQTLCDQARRHSVEVAGEMGFHFDRCDCLDSDALVCVQANEFTALEIGFGERDLSRAYWEVVVALIQSIGEHLRPLVTPDQSLEGFPMSMDEEAEHEYETIKEIITEQGLDERVEVLDLLIAELSVAKELYIIEDGESYQRVATEMADKRECQRQWEVSFNQYDLDAVRQAVAALPSPCNDFERAIHQWIDEVMAALPAHKGESVLQRLKSEQGIPVAMDLHLQVIQPDESDSVRDHIQMVYEFFMQGGDEEDAQWMFDWRVDPKMLEALSQGIDRGNQLLWRLTGISRCT